MNKTEYFAEAKAHAQHEIEYINYELGRVGRKEGKKPIHKEALKKIIEIIDLYNDEKWEKIASLPIE